MPGSSTGHRVAAHHKPAALLCAQPLSPPQGQYSFALFDGEKRQVFAARDSSGSEPLYYELAEDGSLSLSNSRPAVPAADSSDEAHVQVVAAARATPLRLR